MHPTSSSSIASSPSSSQQKSEKPINRCLSITLLVVGVASLVLGFGAGVGITISGFYSSTRLGETLVWAFNTKPLTIGLATSFVSTVLGINALWARKTLFSH